MLIKSFTSSYTRLFKVNSPLRDVCVYGLAAFMACSKTIPRTITHRLTQLGLSPVDCALTKYVSCHSICAVMELWTHLVNLYIVLILLSYGLTSI